MCKVGLSLGHTILLYVVLLHTSLILLIIIMQYFLDNQCFYYYNYNLTISLYSVNLILLRNCTWLLNNSKTNSSLVQSINQGCVSKGSSRCQDSTATKKKQTEKNVKNLMKRIVTCLLYSGSIKNKKKWPYMYIFMSNTYLWGIQPPRKFMPTFQITRV